jgi:tRNA (adenine22-N1)-methyltransferase
MKSLRLLTASKYIAGFNCLADCGTDHGKLPIYCVKNNLVKKAYASDNKEKPLNNAKKNIFDNNLQNSVIPVLADGLTYLNEEVDVVSILGMGGRLIVSILEEAELKNVKRLILIANSENEILRTFLQKINWKIIAEELIHENRKNYQLIVLEKGQMVLSNLEREFGPFIIKEKSNQFINMIKKQINGLKTAVKNAKNEEVKQDLNKRIMELEEIIT